MRISRTLPRQLYLMMITSLCTMFGAGTIAAEPAHYRNGTLIALRDIESDAADRVRLVGILRTLSQQVAAASCTLTSGIDVEEAYEVLATSSAAFERYVAALQHGDEELHILGVETDRGILHDLAAIEAEWSTIDGAIDAVLADVTDVDSSHIIDDHSNRLLELTSTLSTDVVGVYSNPYEMTSRDAFLIEITGRQLMLTQKLARDACEIWSDYHADLGKADLAENMVVFENSLHALRFGLPAAGITAAPNDVIRDGLDRLLARWAIIKVNQQTLLDGGTLNDEQKTEIFRVLQLELADLEQLLKDYKEYSERNH